MALDYVRACRQEKCPLAKECSYFRENVRVGACQVELRFIKRITESFQMILEKDPDPFIMQWVGLHVIPLYHDLVKFRMEEMAITGNKTVADKSGKLSVHPIYREIRDTIKAIRSEWKDSGLMEFAKKHGFLGVGLQLKGVSEPLELQEGQPGFYEAMSGSASKEEPEEDSEDDLPEEE